MLWKLLAAAVALGAIWLALDVFGDARHAAGVAEERGHWQALQTAKAERIADQRVAEAHRGQRAIEASAARLAAIVPLLLEIDGSVKDYAKTDAGRVLCRGADRVRQIEELDAILWPAVPDAGGAGRALPADPATPPA